MPPMPDGYLVTRPFPESNVGSNLASMAGALWLAGELDRTLVVDWRGLSQLSDPSLNYFSEFFATPPELAGGRVLYAPAPEAGAYEEGAPGTRLIELEEAYELRVGNATTDAGTLVVQRYHGLDRIHPGPDAERFRLLRTCYGDVRPAPELAALVDGWWTEHCDGASVVGVNVRTGNGRYFGKGMPYANRVATSVFENRERFLRVIERAVRARLQRLPRSLRDDFVVFYATDSAWMSELLGRLPNAATRRRRFPPPAAGDTYAFTDPDYSDRDGVLDTLADMFLLARCDALVFNTSLFNQYARVVTDNFGGNLVHFEGLFLRRRAQLALGRAQLAVRRRL